MYSVMPTLTWSLMHPAIYSRLCGRDSAWVGVFARSTMSSAKSVSIIVSVGYNLFLFFFFPNRSIGILSTFSRHIMNRYGAELLQQCWRSLSQSSESTLTFIFLKSIIIVLTVSLGRPYARSICSIFSVCMEKSTNKSVASRFLHELLWFDRLLEFAVLDWFLRKPFWFFF